MTIGETVISLRKSKHLTQVELAKRLNISQSTLAMYESEKRDPSTEMLIKIADYFNVSTDFIMGLDKNPALRKHAEIDDNICYNGKDIPYKYKKILKELMDMDDWFLNSAKN